MISDRNYATAAPSARRSVEAGWRRSSRRY